MSENIREYDSNIHDRRESFRETLRLEVIEGNLSIDGLYTYAKEFTREEIEYSKRLIREEAKREEIKRFNYYMDLYRDAVGKTSYKKGEVNVETVYLPFPTMDAVLKNKELSMKTYGALLLDSSYGGKVRNLSDRYIYLSQVEDNLEEIAAQISTSSKKVSVRTLKKYIKALSKCPNVKILEPMKNFDNEVYYRLNYSQDEKYYTLIHDVALRKLINAYSENALRTYLVILYICYDYNNDSTTPEVKYAEKEISQDFICRKIGLKTTSRKLLTDCIEALSKGGFIKVRLEYKVHHTIKDSEIIKTPIPKYYYSISKDYMKKNHILR